MTDKIRVLVFPAGELNSAELHEALSRQVNIELYGASSIERLGHHLFARYRNDLPLISDPIFVETFNALIDEWAIDVVIPTHDTVVTYLASNRNQFKTRLLVPPIETAEICRDKHLTYEHLAGCSFVPQTYSKSDNIDREVVFVKPRLGQGSQGARVVEASEQTLADIDWDHEVVCEYLQGEELTVDCVTDQTGELRGVFPRTRDRVLGGISVAGRTLDADGETMGIARAINERLDFLGLWYYQAKRGEDGRLKLLEVSARVSGSSCLTRARGVNLPLISLYFLMGLDVEIAENPIGLEMDRMLVSLYDFDYTFDTVYIDYDDTIIGADGADPDVMGLLYQFRRDGKKIVLITRHEGDLSRSLEAHCIDPNMFESIVRLNEEDLKHETMIGTSSIFIDNAYRERSLVRERHQIPVFDVEGIQVLKRWIR